MFCLSFVEWFQPYLNLIPKREKHFISDFLDYNLKSYRKYHIKKAVVRLKNGGDSCFFVLLDFFAFNKQILIYKACLLFIVHDKR